MRWNLFTIEGRIFIAYKTYTVEAFSNNNETVFIMKLEINCRYPKVLAY